MDLKPRRGTGRKVFRGGLAIVVGISLIGLYLLCTVFQDTMRIDRLFRLATSDDYTGSAYGAGGHLVWSPKCHIPDLDPFDESIRTFATRAKPIVCSNKPPLTYITVVPEGAHKHLLKLNTSAVAYYAVQPANVNCCYSVITRVSDSDGKEYSRTADNAYSVSECSNFDTEVALNSEEEFTLVRCFKTAKRGTKREVYKNTHAVVPVKREVELKLSKSNSQRSSVEKKRLSVLVLGFDSVSRLSLLRTMPKTVHHLRRNGWLELLGYNKIGENTLPNLAAILMGLSQDQLKKQCWASRYEKFDNCPFIWREFSNLGYVTAYVEDEPAGSTFNYHKTGFVVPPTDYYIRPFLLASEHKLSVRKRDFLNVCLGPTPTSEHIFRYITDFATVFKSALYFVMCWINNFSHNSNAIPATVDERVTLFFRQLSETGAFNTTFMIFLSDHGMRWGDIRRTSIGWFEERLPFVYIWVPEWFKQKHPEFYKNLTTNRNRLTSPFDLHLTLREILELSRQDNVKWIPNECPGCPKCVSLFSEVSADRDCEDAGITENWCTCNKYSLLAIEDKAAQAVALHVLSEINSKLKKTADVSASCAELTLDHIISVKRKVPLVPHGDFIVTFVTAPGGGVFEATARSSNGSFQLMGDISRINTYGNQSDCVDDAEVKLYCFCT